MDELSCDAKIPKLTSVTQELMTHKYRNAKMKNLKIYSEEEINTAPSKMERTRRHFWNEKAEQLTTRQATAGQSKSTLIGIIDVAWTLRKTALIDVEARELKDKDNVIVRTYDETPKSKKGTQKNKPFQKIWIEWMPPMQLWQGLTKSFLQRKRGIEKKIWKVQAALRWCLY